MAQERGGIGDVIRNEIRSAGPLTFARYMELALYGPGGFYGHPPVGVAGDFVTSPHVHPVFGELLATAVRQVWEILGQPQPFRVAEVGAGDGTLARQLLGALAGLPLTLTAVEISPGAREMLVQIDGVEVAANLDGTADLVLAHELLDNLPFAVVRDGLEVRVGLDGDRLVEVYTSPGDDLASHGPFGEGETIVSVGVVDMVDRVAGALASPGAFLVIDYAAGAASPPHGYAAHGIVEDLLASPGATDITAGVDLDVVTERARERGMVAFEPVTQQAALQALGFTDWYRDELERQHTALDERDGMAAVRTWSGRSRASLLVDPGGLGRFRWLLLTTPGVDVPPWLAAAQAAGGRDAPA